jgi:hypothetical protein
MTIKGRGLVTHSQCASSRVTDHLSFLYWAVIAEFKGKCYNFSSVMLAEARRKEWCRDVKMLLHAGS